MATWFPVFISQQIQFVQLLNMVATKTNQKTSNYLKRHLERRIRQSRYHHTLLRCTVASTHVCSTACGFWPFIWSLDLEA